MTMRAVLAATVVALLSAVAPAHAELRSGTVSDPSGDSAGAPSQDIISATAQYDTNGQVTITATMNGDIASGPDSFFSTDVKSFAAPSSCSGASVSIFGFYTSRHPSLMISGVSGIGEAYETISGNTLALSRSLSQLADKDWSCLTLTVAPRGATGSTLDTLDVPLFFDGYGPDTERDRRGDGRGGSSPEAAAPSDAQPIVNAPTPTVATPVPAACQKFDARKHSVCITRQGSFAVAFPRLAGQRWFQVLTT